MTVPVDIWQGQPVSAFQNQLPQPCHFVCNSSQLVERPFRSSRSTRKAGSFRHIAWLECCASVSLHIYVGDSRPPRSPGETPDATGMTLKLNR